ncbi:peptidoglycan-recognition protein LB-like [Anastrepha ludens]|uniref:peptidoglycan-recognition protein LB-like n=1 Tax=Anastrepha ludens TaxID=28586 RepID=UPI0023AFCF8C|nr:peptidoglycan-recognition protein LB-like [Anastrepha ludens]
MFDARTERTLTFARAAGAVGCRTSTHQLLLLVSLLLAGNMAMFTSINTIEACALPKQHSKRYTESLGGDVTSNQILGYMRDWRLIRRAEWNARTPTEIANFTGPAPFVILHHSYQPGVCQTEDACKAAMRSMQNYHMDQHGWPDIGYSFAVGGDGNVYEGRGYEVVGAHAPNYNSRSIGLLLIGNFMEELPPAPMQQVAQDFIEYSMEGGHLPKDYILHGHRQVRDTECPGDALYAAIKEWPHWKELDSH